MSPTLPEFFNVHIHVPSRALRSARIETQRQKNGNFFVKGAILVCVFVALHFRSDVRVEARDMIASLNQGSNAKVFSSLWAAERRQYLLGNAIRPRESALRLRGGFKNMFGEAQCRNFSRGAADMPRSVTETLAPLIVPPCSRAHACWRKTSC